MQCHQKCNKLHYSSDLLYTTLTHPNHYLFPPRFSALVTSAHHKKSQSSKTTTTPPPLPFSTMQEEDYFILAIIRHKFGYTPSQVAQALLNNSNQTIADIIATTGLSHEAVVSTLVALLQHDIVTCQGPHDVPRPPKANTGRSRVKKGPNGLDYDPESPHAYETTTSLVQFGDLSTRLYGNCAAGYVPESQVIQINAVYQPILPTQRMEYDNKQSANAVTRYHYSINRGMVRGISRAAFYGGLILEVCGPDSRCIFDEFIFRGKLTISKALEYVIERMVAEDDFNLRILNKVDGYDPVYTADDFNAMTRQDLENLSIWAFNRARLMADRNLKEENNGIVPISTKSQFLGGIKTELLEMMDQIELSRYELVAPRAATAFIDINKYFLLVESPGYLDLSIISSNPSTLNPTNLPPVTQPLNGVVQSNQPPQAEKPNETILHAKKRKIAEISSVSVINAVQNTNTFPNEVNPFDDEDLFDPLPATSKRAKTSATPTGYRPNPLENDDYSSQPLLSSGPYQSPLSKEQKLYIINHDRITLLFRSEIFSEFISAKVSITAGLIVGAINLDSLQYENPSSQSEYTIPMIKNAFERYVAIKHRQYNPNQFTPAVLESLPKLQPTAANIHAEFTTMLSALQHFIAHPVTTTQLNVALNRLTRASLTDPTNRELHYALTCTPNQSTVRQSRLIQQTNQTAGLDRGDITNDYSSDHDTAYLIQYHKIAQSLRREYLLTYVFTKFGSTGRRVIGTLLDHTRLEEKQISDFSLAPKHAVKEILNSCLQDGLLDTIDVPTSSDRLTPSKTFYLWGIDYSLSGKRLLAIFYKSFANTLLRLDVQRDQSTQYIDKMLLQRHMEVTDVEAFAGRDYKLTFARIMHVLNGTMKSIMLFKDLCPK